MNIFVIEGSIKTQEVDWVKSAKSLDNYRVVKMATETCQILSTAMHIIGAGLDSPYKPFNEKHPCNIWSARSSVNFKMLINYLMHLMKEYHERFPNGVHSADIKLDKISSWYDEWCDYYWNCKLDESTPIPFCLPEKFNDGNLITSYRKFYANKPRLRYPVSKIPEWLSEYRDLKTIEII